jgi:hypothetical protein
VTAIPLPTLSGDERPVPSIPQPSPPNQPDARAEVILGIDTHKDVHAAVVISLLGVVLGRRCFSTTASGYESLLDWARGFGALRRAGVECTGSYGKADWQRIQTEGAALNERLAAAQSAEIGVAGPPGMPLLNVPSVLAKVIFTEPAWTVSVFRLSSLPGN